MVWQSVYTGDGNVDYYFNTDTNQTTRNVEDTQYVPPTPEQSAAQITQNYQSLLGRTPSADEIAGWQQTIQQGATLQQVQQAISTSPEFQQAKQPFVQQGVDQSTAQSFGTGAQYYQQNGYIPAGDYEGVPTAYYDPKTGKLAAWYGTTGSFNTSDYQWHTPQQLAPGEKIVTAQARAPDNQLKDGVTGALGVLSSVLAPAVIGFIADIMEPGITAATAVMQGTSAYTNMASGIYAAGLAAANAAATGKDPYTAAAAGAITGGLAPYLTAEFNSAITDPSGRALADYITKVASGATAGGITGGTAGAEVGGFTSAATGALGAAAGALGKGIATDVAPPDTMTLGDTEYVLDSEGNLKLDEKGNPISLSQYQEQASQQFSSFAQKVGAPYISQNLSSLFSSPTTSALTPTSSTSSVTPTGEAAYSTQPTTLSGGSGGNTTSTLSGALGSQNVLGTQGTLGTQAQAQVLNLGNPSTATSDTGDTSVPTPETGGTPQNVWNTSSLRVKDATGSDTNV